MKQHRGAFSLRNLDGTRHLGVVNGCRMKPYYGMRQPIASPQILSIRCEPMAEDRLQKTTEENHRGKQAKEDTTKKKKIKTQKCKERLNKNDEVTINEADANHEIAINLEGSNDTQIKEKKHGKIIKEKKSREKSKHDASKAASTNNSSRSK